VHCALLALQCVREMKYNVENINKVKNTVEIKGTLFGRECRVGSENNKKGKKHEQSQNGSGNKTY